MRALLALAFLTTAAVAQDYPIQGLIGATDLVSGPPPATVAHVVPVDALARCAAVLIDQRPDGTFTTYIADRKAFAAGELAYDPIVSGKCTIATDGTETCVTQRQSASLPDPLEFYDVPHNPTASGLDIAVYDTLEDAKARADSPGYFTFFHCPIDEDVARAALRTELSTLSADEINAHRFPTPEMLADPTTLAIADAIRKQ